jgi:hypothetical protein
MNAAVALVAGVLALAPMAGSTRTDAYTAGPYTVTVTRVEPVDVGSTAAFAVSVAPADGAGVVAITLPGPGTTARPGRTVVGAGARPGTYEVTATFPVRGAWVLAIDVAGRAGRGRAAVPVTAAAPGAIPIWLGWAIGLSPLVGLAAFLAVQVRAARRLRLSRNSPVVRESNHHGPLTR